VRIALLALALLALTALALLWLLPPPGPRRSAREKCRLDDVVPEFQFEEFHERFVRASPGAVDCAIRTVPADEIALFTALTWLRNPMRSFRPQGENILNPPPKKPVLDVALGSGFVLLADEPGREIVLGTLVARPSGARLWVPADVAERARHFAALEAPGFAKAAMNFRMEPRDGGCRLTTETRVFATDPATARAFARYWRVVHPGSALLRRTWLRAVAVRAERP
jgi:hypothetical protein